jgi:hypothetical protein
MDFRNLSPYIADQYLAESERRAKQRARLYAGRSPRSRRRERVT